MNSRFSFKTLPEPFSEDEVSLILDEIKKKINVKFSKDEDVPKTILVDAFGTQKAGKTKTTEKIEQVFRRHKFRAFCPPETAEIESVRSQLTSDPMLSQATHLNGVEDYVLSLARHPRIHFAMISRGPIDMLYWYERDRRKGNYSDTFYESISRYIYELLRKDQVDTFLFFTCSVEAAIKREYDGALTQRRGSKMNESDIAETIDIYDKVIREVNENVPGLPIFRIDTSNLDVREVGQEVLRFLLPTICQRFNILPERFMHHSPTLLRKSAKSLDHFEVQLKLKGHPSRERILEFGFNCSGILEQEDTYLDLSNNPNDQSHNFSDEVARIRKDQLGLRFMYKGPVGDAIFSHRHPLSLNIEKEDADRMLGNYKNLLFLRKIRECFDAGSNIHDLEFITIHLDKIEGLGHFTEIRTRGSVGQTHTNELLEIAAELGFSLSDVIQGNYLSLALKN
jgi:predicted adenylyl cyclase CyaB